MHEITTLKRLPLTDMELLDFNPRRHENARELKDLASLSQVARFSGEIDGLAGCNC